MNTAVIFTKREEQIITGIVMGYCKKEIANELSKSVRTIEAETRTAMIKAEVKKSTDLVVLWFVKRFSIPIEALPKSITALIFLVLFIPFEFSTHREVIRINRTKSECRRSEGRREDNPTIEF